MADKKSAVKKASVLRRYISSNTKKLHPLKQNVWFMLLAAVVIAISQLTLLWRPVVGIYFNAAALAILVGIALWKDKLQQTAISVAIIPTATMIVLALPQTTLFAQTVVFYDAILVLAIIYRLMFTLDYPLGFTRMTLKGYGLAVPLMLVLGEVLGLLGYGMLRHHYTFGHTSLPLVAASVVVFALAEETLFRGLIQQRASQIMHPMVAALLTTMLFTFAGINNITYLAPLFSLILGAVLSYTYTKKQNLLLTGSINALAKLTYVGLMASFVFR